MLRLSRLANSSRCLLMGFIFVAIAGCDWFSSQKYINPDSQSKAEDIPPEDTEDPESIEISFSQVTWEAGPRLSVHSNPENQTIWVSGQKKISIRKFEPTGVPIQFSVDVGEPFPIAAFTLSRLSRDQARSFCRSEEWDYLLIFHSVHGGQNMICGPKKGWAGVRLYGANGHVEIFF